MDGRTDGWMDGRTDGRTDGWMDNGNYIPIDIPSVKIISEQLNSLAYCNVDFTFLMTNVIKVHINVVKLDRNNSVDISLDPSIKCADPLNRHDGGRLLVKFNYSFTITSDQRNNTLTIFTIHVTPSSSGTSVASCPCNIQLPNDI
jgi:hypothetical protein